MMLDFWSTVQPFFSLQSKHGISKMFVVQQNLEIKVTVVAHFLDTAAYDHEAPTPVIIHNLWFSWMLKMSSQVYSFLLLEQLFPPTDLSNSMFGFIILFSFSIIALWWLSLQVKYINGCLPGNCQHPPSHCVGHNTHFGENLFNGSYIIFKLAKIFLAVSYNYQK